MGWPDMRKVAHRFGFTDMEARAVVLIASAGIVGAALSAFLSPESPQSFQKEYRRMDSMFAAQTGRIDEKGDTVGDEAKSGYNASQLDINTAAASDFEALPGIGPVIAKRIVDYRNRHGRFKRLDDLIKVKSIGEKKYQRIEPYICISE